MRLAPPMLPNRWKLQRHEDGSATLLIPSSARGAVSLESIASSGFSCLLCPPVFLIVGVFYLARLCLGREVWRLTASRINTRSLLFGITWQSRSYEDCTFDVNRISSGLWQLRLYESQECSTLYQSDRLPVVLSLAAFLSEELGWGEYRLGAAPAFLRKAIDEAFLREDTGSLRLLFEDPRTPPLVAQAWREQAPPFEHASNPDWSQSKRATAVFRGSWRRTPASFGCSQFRFSATGVNRARCQPYAYYLPGPVIRCARVQCTLSAGCETRR